MRSAVTNGSSGKFCIQYYLSHVLKKSHVLAVEKLNNAVVSDNFSYLP